jgi:hypothetical protein
MGSTCELDDRFLRSLEQKLSHCRLPKNNFFKNIYLAITNNNMAAARISEAGAALLTLLKVPLKAHLNLSITWRLVVSFKLRLLYF